MNCPHCGTDLRPDMVRCSECGWKVRLSQILAQPENIGRLRGALPTSAIYYLFADRLLEPAAVDSLPNDAEQALNARNPVGKRPLAIALVQTAFIGLAQSRQLQLFIQTPKALAFGKNRSVVAKPIGIYEVSAGSLESRILDTLYDRWQGLAVPETLEKIMGFWYTDDPYEWVIRVVRQHLLASYAAGDMGIGPVQMQRLLPQFESVKASLESFAAENPDLSVTLWNVIQRNLGSRKR